MKKLIIYISIILISSNLAAQANDPLRRYQKNQIQISEELEKDIIVAILDTGIDYNHPDLNSNIAKNEIECDEGQPQISNITDRDNNGFPGDCLGWNFIPNEAAADARAEEMTTHEMPHLPFDNEGHGTHVSGIIGAVANNNVGISNSTNRIKILPIKVFPKSTQASSNFRIMINKQMLNANRTSILIQAIDFAIKRNVDVINLSIGWNKNIETPELRKKIEQALNKGIIIVAAAGNDASEVTTFPCLYENVICVGASDDQQNIAKISNYGNGVDFLAPGVDILSTFPLNQIFVQFLDGYSYYSGTSQAAPYLSKLIAIIKGLNPDISRIEILRRLHLSTKAFGHKNTHMASPFITSGIVDAQAAISMQENLNSSLIIPSFKSLNQISLDEQQRARISIPLHLFSPLDSNFKINLEPESKGIEVLNSVDYTIKNYPASLTLEFGIQVKDLSINQKQTFNLIISNAKTNSIQSFKFNSKLYLSPKNPLNSFSFDYTTAQPYFTTRGNDKGTALKNILNFYEEKSNYFYVEFFSKQADVVSSRLTLHHLTPESFKEVATTTHNDVVLSYGLKMVDLNKDNVPEFIYTAEAIDKESKKRYVKIFYLNQDLKPVYADVPYLRYDLIFPLYFKDLRNPLYPLGNITIVPISIGDKILPQIVGFQDYAILNNYQALKKYFLASSPAGIGPDVFFFNPELKNEQWIYSVKALSSELLEQKWSSLLPKSTDGQIKAYNSLCKDCTELQFAVIHGKGKLEKFKAINTKNSTLSASIQDLSSYAKKYDSLHQSYMAVNVYANKKIHLLDLSNYRSWWGNLPHAGPWRVLKIGSTSELGARALLTDGSMLVSIKADQAGTVKVSNLVYGKYFGTSFSTSSDLFDISSLAGDSLVQLLGNKISDIGLSFIDLSGDTLALTIENSMLQKSNCLTIGNFYFSSLKQSHFIQLCQETPSKLKVEIY